MGVLCFAEELDGRLAMFDPEFGIPLGCVMLTAVDGRAIWATDAAFVGVTEICVRDARLDQAQRRCFDVYERFKARTRTRMHLAVRAVERSNHA